MIPQSQPISAAAPHPLSEYVAQKNGVRTDYPRDKTVAALFESVTKKHAGRVALLFGDVQVTYRELNERANRLACLLRSSGVQHETLVACVMDRSIEYIVAILAILKAGGAYVPIDPEYPAARIDFILRDTQAPLVLTDRASLLADAGAKFNSIKDALTAAVATED